MITLRYPCETDLEELRQIRNNYSNAFEFTGFITSEMQTEWYKNLIQIPNQQELFVINVNEQIAGTIGYVLNKQREMEVGKIMLAQQYRGKKIFHTALNVLSSSVEHSRLFLTVKRDNTPAITAYLREGFLATSVQEDKYIMERQK